MDNFWDHPFFKDTDIEVIEMIIDCLEVENVVKEGEKEDNSFFAVAPLLKEDEIPVLISPENKKQLKKKNFISHETTTSAMQREIDLLRHQLEDLRIQFDIKYEVILNQIYSIQKNETKKVKNEDS